MKTRIIALILTVVMVLLALTSCSNSFDLARENLNAYAEFKLDDFLKALKSIEIEDGEFTTDEATRNKFVAAQVYNAIVDKILAASKDEDHVKTGELTAGDVLYFVYYAVDADGNEFFGTPHMKPSTVTDKNYAAGHVVRLGDNLDKKGNEFFKLIAENLQSGNLEDFIFSSLTAAELQNKALEALLEKNSKATEEEKNAAKADAIKLVAGDKIIVEFTRTHTTKIEGNDSTVTEKATYTILDSEDPLYDLLFAEGTTAKVGQKVTFGKDSDNKDITFIKHTIGETEYTYKDITVLAKVENEGKAIATFEYTPYDVDKSEQTPSSLYTTASKVNLGKKALTYYVYPVYAIDAPVYEDITAADLLYHLNGSKLTKDSYKEFKTEGYKNGDKTLEDLLKDIPLIFDSNAKDNALYAEGTALKKALDEYDAAVKAGGTKPTDEQKKTITEKSKALADAQDVALKEVIAKIVACKNADNKVLGEELLKNYVEGVRFSLKDAYDKEIIKAVGKEVLDLIYESVTIKAYPENLLKEFCDHVYEAHEYEFYTGTSSDKKTSNFEKYGSFDNYLKEKLGSDVDSAIEKEAKKNLDPILKIFVVAQALEKQANKDMPGYVDADIKAGYYREDGKDNEETYKTIREQAGKFLIDDAFMKEFKSNSSSSAYNQYVKENGEINIRTALQFQKLFEYLTSVEHVENKTMEKIEVKYTEDGTKLSFRVLDYKIAVKEAEGDKTEDNTNN